MSVRRTALPASYWINQHKPYLYFARDRMRVSPLTFPSAKSGRV
ncbi:hypothetical protein [Streptomyces sp. SP18BB07]|nr:hypothetical protein [Streptomyces sp. SP18BB07]MEE1765249.1 hypothetical protein [Streptomyces sp. SP18BB07]